MTAIQKDTETLTHEAIQKWVSASHSDIKFWFSGRNTNTWSDSKKLQEEQKTRVKL